MATIPIGIQYVTDEEGKPTGVIVPIDLWREIVSEQETAHLLKSEATRQRLLAALARHKGIPFEVVREKLEV
jgi:antitoxin YefM